MQSDRSRSVPVLLKVESLDTVSPASEIEPELAATLAQFLKEADLVSLTNPYSKR